MRIGLFTSGYQRNYLEDAFRDAKRFGYDYIELWGGRPHAYAPDLRTAGVSEILNLIEKYSMPVLGYTPELNAYPYNFMCGNEQQWNDAVSYIKMSMEVAKEIGAKFTLISAGHAGYGETLKKVWERLLKTARIIADYAEKIDHTVIFETLTPYESNVCTTSAELQYLLETVNSKRLMGMCDVVPPFVIHEPIINYIKRIGQKMVHMHLVDNDGISDAHIVPGDGCIPLKEYLEEAKNFGYDATITIELVTAYLNEPSLYAKRAIEHVQGWI